MIKYTSHAHVSMHRAIGTSWYMGLRCMCYSRNRMTWSASLFSRVDASIRRQKIPIFAHVSPLSLHISSATCHAMRSLVVSSCVMPPTRGCCRSMFMISFIIEYFSTCSQLKASKGIHTEGFDFFLDEIENNYIKL